MEGKSDHSSKSFPTSHHQVRRPPITFLKTATILTSPEASQCPTGFLERSKGQVELKG